MITASPTDVPAGSSRLALSDRSASPSRYHSGNIATITPALTSAAHSTPRNTLNSRTTTSTSLISTSQVTPRRSSTSTTRSSTNRNFSLALTGSPSGRKHRPSPLELGENSNMAEQSGRVLRQSKSKMGLKDRMKGIGRNSPRSPKTTLAKPDECC